MSGPPAVEPPVGRGLRLLDMAALVVGYGLAALGLRAFWTDSVVPTLPLGVALGLAYAWLGLVVSGPFVLLLEGRRRSAPRQTAGTNGPERPPDAGPPGRDACPPAEEPSGPRYTSAETAWILIGAYWIAVIVIVVPARLPSQATPMLGVLPIVAAIFFWVLSPGAVPVSPDRRASWTHKAAVAVLATWPLAWCAMILLSTTLS